MGHRSAALAFGAGTGLVLAYALRGGGSYDLVTFEEYGLVIWFAVAVGLALGLFPRARPARPVVLLVAALAAYTAWTALSILWTRSAELTSVEVARTLDYLGLVVLLASIFKRESWRFAGAGLGFGGLLVCVIAVGSPIAPGVFGVTASMRFCTSIGSAIRSVTGMPSPPGALCASPSRSPGARTIPHDCVGR